MKKTIAALLFLLVISCVSFAYQNPYIDVDTSYPDDCAFLMCPAIVTGDIEIKTQSWQDPQNVKSGDIIYCILKDLYDEKNTFDNTCAIESDAYTKKCQIVGNNYELLKGEEYYYICPGYQTKYVVSNKQGAIVYSYPNKESKIITIVSYGERVDNDFGNHVYHFRDGYKPKSFYGSSKEIEANCVDKWVFANGGFINCDDLKISPAEFTILHSGNYGMLPYGYKSGDFIIPENGIIKIVLCQDDIHGFTYLDYYYNDNCLLKYLNEYDSEKFENKKFDLFYSNNISSTGDTYSFDNDRNDLKIITAEDSLNAYKYPDDSSEVAFTYSSGDEISYTFASKLRYGEIGDRYSAGTWFYVSKDGLNGYVRIDDALRLSGDTLYSDEYLELLEMTKNNSKQQKNVEDVQQIEEINTIDDSGNSSLDIEDKIIDTDNDDKIMDKNYIIMFALLVVLVVLIILFLVLKTKKK